MFISCKSGLKVYKITAHNNVPEIRTNVTMPTLFVNYVWFNRMFVESNDFLLEKTSYTYNILL